MLFVTAIAGTGLAVLASSKPHKYEYLALGDSYTIGHTCDYRNNYPNQVAALLRSKGIDLADPVVIAHGGWPTWRLLKGLDVYKPKGPFEVVTVLMGTNNINLRSDTGTYIQDMRTILQRAIKYTGGRADHVIIISLPDYSGSPRAAADLERERLKRELDRLNRICKSLAEEYGCAYADITPLSRQLATHPDYFATDGMHPSDWGYQQWTEVIGDKMYQVLQAH